MSRTVPVLLAALLLYPLPAAAQQDESPTAEQALESAEQVYGPPAPEPECEPGDGDEIVVCAELEEQSQFRVRSDEDAEDDYARETMDKGDPRAPDVAGPGIFRGPATVGGLCLIPPCPREPAIFIDLSALPEAPPGSDADRIARGLPPLGNDGATENPAADGESEAAPE